MRLQACYEQNEVGALKPSEGMKWDFDGVRKKKNLQKWSNLGNVQHMTVFVTLCRHKREVFLQIAKRDVNVNHLDGTSSSITIYCIRQ